jgi:hypothetical protein
MQLYKIEIYRLVDINPWLLVFTEILLNLNKHIVFAKY